MSGCVPLTWNTGPIMAGASPPRRARRAYQPVTRYFHRAFTRLCREHRLTLCQEKALAIIARQKAARPGGPGAAIYLAELAYELRRSRAHTQRVMSQLVAAGLLARAHGQRLPSRTTATGWTTIGPTGYHLTPEPAGALWRVLELRNKPPTATQTGANMGKERATYQPPDSHVVIAEMRRGQPPPERIYWYPTMGQWNIYMYCTRHDLQFRECRECRIWAKGLLKTQ